MHEPLRRRSTAIFQRTCATGLGWRRVRHPVFAPLQLLAREGLPGRTVERVRRRVVVERGTVEQRSIALVVDGAIGRHMRQDAFCLAGFGLFAVGVAGVGNNIQRGRTANCLLCGLGHRQQAAVVGCLAGDLLGHDQRMFGIHRGLHVVGRRMAMTYAHEVRLRFPMPFQLFQRLSHSARVDDYFFLSIGRFHSIQIALHGLALAHAARTAHGQELRTVDSHPFAAHQTYRTSKANQLGPRLSHCLPMDAPELGDALVIGRQAAQQPHHFNVASALGFQSPRRADLLQIAIEIKLQ